MNKIKNHPILLTLTLLFVVNTILFRDMIFSGKVPIAFDYGVYTYQPWKLEYEESFIKSPKPIGHDDIRIFYPQRKFTIDALKKGEIPLWNPYEFVGNVHLANSQTAVFYPPFLLFLFLPQSLAWSWLSFIVPLLAGVGSFLFLRRILKSNLAATFGALVFAFSSAVITRTEDGLVAGHSIVWLPWVLYGIELFFKKKDWRGVVVTVASLMLSMLAGWFQFTFYVFAVGFLYGLFRWKDLLTLFVAFLTSVMLTAFHWLPALEALRYSPRGVLGTPPEFLTNHLMPLSHLVTLIIPNFFGHIANNTYYGASEFKEGVIAIGVVTFLLSVFALGKKKKTTPFKFFLGAFVLSLLLGTKNPIAQAVISLNIPLISTFLPNRIMIVSSFALSVLAAFGISRFIRTGSKKLQRVTTLGIRLFLIFYVSAIGLFVYEKLFSKVVGMSFFEKGIERYVRLSLEESVLPFTLLILLFIVLRLANSNRNRLVLTAIFLMTIASQLFYANRYLYFSDSTHEFPDNPIFSFLRENTREDASRFLSLSFSRIPSNVPTYYNLYFPEGVDAMYPIWYGEFTEYFKKSQSTIGPPSRIEVAFSDIMEKPRKFWPSRWLDPWTVNLLSHLGIRYVLIPKDAYHVIPPEPAFEKVFAHKWHTVYEYKYAFPKAYFVPNFTLSNQKTTTLQRIFHPFFFDSLEVVLSLNGDTTHANIKSRETEDVSNIDLVKKQEKKYETLKKDPYALVRQVFRSFAENPVKVSQYEANKIVLEANVKEDGFIVVNDSYFPGWKAELDDVPTQIFRANHAFRAIPIQKGEHEITFSYRPASFDVGRRVSATTAIASLMFSGALVVKKRSERKGQ